jgi:hypothetical protein
MAPHDTALAGDLVLSLALPRRLRTRVRSSAGAVVEMAIRSPVREQRFERRRNRPLVPFAEAGP